MALYISQSSGRQGTLGVKSWRPGDTGVPNLADTKEELLLSCPKPVGFCSNLECLDQVRVTPHRNKRWGWSKGKLCHRCLDLRHDHGLELTELLALWEKQDRSCYCCGRELDHPRANRQRSELSINIDHDHKICPPAKNERGIQKRSHSCERCRRGLSCRDCNMRVLTEKAFWSPIASRNPSYWFLILGTDNYQIAINRLHDAISLLQESALRITIFS